MTKDKKINKERVKYLGASDTVNGTASLYVIEEKEMETAIDEVYQEIGSNKEK